ncbi:MAG: ABC-F family ATP-binding cassette domain-containing protein [Actinomycetota bacterium]|nr:ABC-F family ATP-binding cassette domain-containing protein [Actinomycetota bacterium]
MPPRNLVNLEAVSQAFGDRPLLSAVSTGVGDGDRIGVVGRNGAGKTTLLDVLGGVEPPDAGRVSVASGVHLGYLRQSPPFDPAATILQAVVGERATHEWAAQPRVREVLDGLLGGYDDDLLDRRLGDLSGGERRRVELARLLVAELDLLLLDEPTNHLDVEVVGWLARYLRARPALAVVVVTHDRWFLDEVCERTWEVVDGAVEEYDGGYSAYVLAKAERTRQGEAMEARRSNLIRKELAWLRRGAPARTSKPKFRVDAANELIATEPPPRDAVELLSFADARLGKTVIEAHDATVSVGRRVLVDRLSWNIGPGQRIGILGANGAGKTTLVRTLLGQIPPLQGRIVTGQTVRPAYLSQHLEELDPSWRVLEAVELVAQRVDLGKGRELTASQLCERLGFGTDGQWTPVGDLSGGERRRLQLTRLLMGAPNVLVLDEPTNDFDVETLTALEDLLDGFAGTLLVVSHDRYFLERVCDDFVALLGDERMRPLTGGLDEYLALRSGVVEAAPVTPGPPPGPVKSDAARQREEQKAQARLERQIEKLSQREARLHEQLAEQATDYEAVTALNEQLRAIGIEREALEEQWLSLLS